MNVLSLAITKFEFNSLIFVGFFLKKNNGALLNHFDAEGTTVAFLLQECS